MGECGEDLSPSGGAVPGVHKPQPETVARRGWDPPSPSRDSSSNPLLPSQILLKCKSMFERLSGHGGVIRGSRLLKPKRGLKFWVAFCTSGSWLVPSHRQAAVMRPVFSWSLDCVLRECAEGPHLNHGWLRVGPQ